VPYFLFASWTDAIAVIWPELGQSVDICDTTSSHASQ